MSFATTTYNIQITAVKAGTGITQTTAELNNLQLSFSGAGGGAGGFANANFAAIRTLQSMVFGLQMSTFYLGMYTAAAGRNENSLLQIENAQIR